MNRLHFIVLAFVILTGIGLDHTAAIQYPPPERPVDPEGSQIGTITCGSGSTKNEEFGQADLATICLSEVQVGNTIEGQVMPGLCSEGEVKCPDNAKIVPQLVQDKCGSPDAKLTCD